MSKREEVDNLVKSLSEDDKTVLLEYALADLIREAGLEDVKDAQNYLVTNGKSNYEQLDAEEQEEE